MWATGGDSWQKRQIAGSLDREDHADEKVSEHFASFLKGDDGKGGKMVAEILAKLPAGRNEPASHEALGDLRKQWASEFAAAENQGQRPHGIFAHFTTGNLAAQASQGLPLSPSTVAILPPASCMKQPGVGQ